MMKNSFKIGLVVGIFSIILTTTGFAGILDPQMQGQVQGQAQGQAQLQGQAQGQGQAQSSINANANMNNNANFNANTNVNENKNNNANANFNANENKNINNIDNDVNNKNINKVDTNVKNNNSNKQQQSVNNNQTIAPVQTLSVTEARQSINAPNLEAFYLVPLQNGRYGDYTKAMPKFKNPSLTPLKGTDEVVKVIAVYFGYSFNRITFDEIESYSLAKAEGIDGSKGNVRYSVRFQESVITTGSGGSAGIADTSGSGLTSWSGGILPSVSKSSSNPMFVITFYEISVPEIVMEKKVSPAPVVVAPVQEIKKVADAPVVISELGYASFKNNSAILNPSAKAILDKNVESLLKNTNKVTIEGYTSTLGSAKRNQVLSEKRAKAVKAYLVGKGIKADRLSTVGYGKTKAGIEKDPKNYSAEDVKANRKVLLTITK